MKKDAQTKLLKLNSKIIRCKKCPRLSSYISMVAKTKVKRHRTEKYWGRPVSGFGDVNAQMLIVGLAPAAHGANRTGRMFTGDSSGDWLTRALFENSFASQPDSTHKNDGLVLHNTYITAAVRCAPPENKPTREEFDNCFAYLENELEILHNTKVIICLGRIAHLTVCKLLGIKMQFAHGKSFETEKFRIICSYHPSRQNTQTGRLSWNQWNMIFQTAQSYLSSQA